MQSIKAKKKLTKLSQDEKVIKPEQFVYQNRHKRLNYVNYIKRKRKDLSPEFKSIDTCKPLIVIWIAGDKNLSDN